MGDIEWKGWKPTWGQMRAAIKWSQGNYKHVGDYRTIRDGALSYLEGLRIALLDTIRVAAEAIVDEGYLDKNVPDWRVDYSHLRDLRNALIDYHYSR